MAYQALYRKYRPRRFDEVLGQEHVTTILKNQVTSGRTAHAYMFSGSRGTGKTSTAKILARAVSCLAPEDGESCGKCAACLVSAGDTPDIIEMDAASNSGVDDIRALIDKARFLPLELPRKVYIIDEAHMLSNAADNALLKTLEEPPAHVVFILATTEPQSVTPTILSRCQRFDFHRLGIEDIVRCVENAVTGVGAQIEREGLVAIARAAEGGMRDALSLADQCLAFCGQRVTAQGVYSVLGSMEGDYLFRVAASLISGDRAGALRALDGVVSGGRDLFVFARDLTQHMRALLLARLCGECADVLACTEDAMRRYIAQAEGVSPETLLRALDVLMNAIANMRYLSLPRVQLECAFVRICSPEEETPQTPELLLERLEKLEAKLAAMAAAPQSPPASAPEPAREEQAPAPKKSAAQRKPTPPPSEIAAQRKPAPPPSEIATQRKPAPPPSEIAASPDGAALWQELKKLVQKQNPSLATLWFKTASVELSGDALIVGFAQKTFAEAFSKQEDMLTSLAGQLRPDTRLRFVVAGAADSLEERAKNAFGGNIEIVD